MTAGNENPLEVFSSVLADAVSRAGASTVMVDARRRHPASGIALSQDLILTADHVIEREEEIRVGLPDGSQYQAALVGRDPGIDLAVLRIDQAKLAPAQQADKQARVGELALALGRPMGDIQASLGVVSALGGPVRTGRGSMLERYLRTDAVPYPGFSGGPLVDAAGSVLGLNTSGLWQGGSLTIPAALAWSMAALLVEHGRLKRGYLGIRSQPVPVPAAQRQLLGRQQTSALLLVGVEDSSPAEKAGLLVGDLLVGIAGQAVNDPDELGTHLVGSLVGQPVELEILRGGQPAKLTVIIGERH